MPIHVNGCWLLAVGCRELLCCTNTDPMLILSCNPEAWMKNLAVGESAWSLLRQTQQQEG